MCHLSPVGTDDATTEAPYASASAPVFEIAEDEYRTCSCVAPGGYGQPLATCWHCHGSGYSLTRRLMRPPQRPDFSEQQAIALIKAKDATIQKAAATLHHAADLFLSLGHPKEAAQTRAAAKAMLEEGT